VATNSSDGTVISRTNAKAINNSRHRVGERESKMSRFRSPSASPERNKREESDNSSDEDETTNKTSVHLPELGMVDWYYCGYYDSYYYYRVEVFR
jgi:hypothetical protein